MALDVAVGLSLPVIFLIFMIAESWIGGGRTFPPVRYWRIIGAIGLTVTLAVNALFPPLVLPLLPSWTPLNFAALGLWGAIPIVVTTTFLTYWSHRIQHRFDLLWRLGHQLHHSVARVDIASAMIFHPIDVVVQATMTLAAAWIVGATQEATALGGVLGFVIALFQHWNIPTPRWAGWFVQRPEMHVLHHERGVHSRNFGDLPVWDMMFGTYANPETVDALVGFSDGRGRRVLFMIFCRDVHKQDRTGLLGRRRNVGQPKATVG